MNPHKKRLSVDSFQEVWGFGKRVRGLMYRSLRFAACGYGYGMEKNGMMWNVCLLFLLSIFVSLSLSYTLVCYSSKMPIEALYPFSKISPPKS